MSHDFPEEAFDMFVHRLNRKNLDRLIEFSCWMSLIDYKDNLDSTGPGNVFAPILNVESVMLFDQALIASKAANYKNEDMTFEDFRFFYKSWLDVIGFRKKYEESAEDKFIGFNRQMLTMISTQRRFQSYSLVERINRAYGFFVAIPNENEELLKSKDKNYMLNSTNKCN